MARPTGRGRTAEILRLLAETGLTQAEIARQVGCTLGNVEQTVKRHGAPARLRVRMTPLPGAVRDWLQAEAKRIGVDIGTFVRAILVDAHAEANPHLWKEERNDNG